MARINDADVLPLVERYRAGDRKAGDELVRVFDRLILSVVNKELRFRKPRIDDNDAVQVARIAVLDAAKRYVDGSLAFCSFAYRYICWAIRLEVHRTAYIVRPGGASHVAQILRASVDFENIDDAVNDLQKRGFGAEVARCAVECVRSGGSYSDVDLEAVDEIDIEDEFAREQKLSLVRAIVRDECGDGKGHDVADRILSEHGLSLKAIGDKFRCSREGVRQFEVKVMGRIKMRIRRELIAA